MDEPKLYFEDMDADLLLVSGTRRIDAEDIVTFARLTGDTNPLHLDADYATGTVYKGRIAHGALILSTATGLAYQIKNLSPAVEAITEIRWKFRNPVRIGDAVQAHFAFRRKHSMPEYNGGLVTFDVEIRNQLHEIVQEGRWTFLVRGQPQPWRRNDSTSESPQ